MARIEHVLCPIDFSDCSRHAFDELGGLKASVGATLFNAYDRHNLAFTEYEVVNTAVDVQRRAPDAPRGQRLRAVRVLTWNLRALFSIKKIFR